MMAVPVIVSGRNSRRTGMIFGVSNDIYKRCGVKK
jgi:hypothetical protein